MVTGKSVRPVRFVIFIMLIAISTAPLSAQAREYLSAIREVDVPQMLRLVRYDWDPNTSTNNPLSTAVMYNSVEAAVLLTEMGASPVHRPAGVMVREPSPLQIALMARFENSDGWLEGDAQPGPSFDRILSVLIEAAATRNPEELRAQIEDSEAPDDVKATVIRDWTYRPDTLENERILISTLERLRRRAFFTAIDTLESGVNDYAVVGLKTKFPLAESELADKDVPARYAANKAFDGDNTTTWVEGADGPGIGQRIAFDVPARAVGLRVLPGYGDPRYFNRNYRVETAVLDLYSILQDPQGMMLTKAVERTLYRFSDNLSLQNIGLPAEIEITPAAQLVGVLTIESVFPTQEWEDTCIAEIQFVAGGH